MNAKITCLALTVAAAATQAGRVLTIESSPNTTVPADVCSGVDSSGVHPNAFTVQSEGGTERVNVQVINLPPGVTVRFSPLAFIISVSSPANSYFPMGLASPMWQPGFWGNGCGLSATAAGVVL